MVYRHSTKLDIIYEVFIGVVLLFKSFIYLLIYPFKEIGNKHNLQIKELFQGYTCQWCF